MASRFRDRSLAALLAGGLALATLLAGCLGLGGGGGTAAPPEIVFSDSRGPGGTAPLIPLTDNVSQDAAAILAACGEAEAMIDCAEEHLKAVLGAVGSGYAFAVLEELAAQSLRIDRASHPMAHVLGRHAVYVYGTIGNTLIHCSHKVFQGCLHGALQEFFEHVEGELEAMDLNGLCPDDASAFELYACMHGLGHGLVLATGYDLARSLDLCARLGSAYARDSCYGGAVMENVVAHNDFVRSGGEYPGFAAYWARFGPAEDDGHAGHGGHAHHGDDGDGGETRPPRFWIEPEDPRFPCAVLASEYEPACWRMQTSLILFLFDGDFAFAAEVCAGLDAAVQDDCYDSLGRDASAWSNRQASGVSARCGHAASEEGRARCIRGAITELVSNYADPAAGVPFCAAIGAEDKPACYEGLGRRARVHLASSELAGFCAEVESAFEAACRQGARL